MAVSVESTIRAFLTTKSTYEALCRKGQPNAGAAYKYKLAQSQFALEMAKLRLLRANGAPSSLRKMVGEKMGKALQQLKYHRSRSPQLTGEAVIQCELGV